MDMYTPPADFKVPKVEPRDQPDVSDPDGVKAQTIPGPTGYKILGIVPDVKDTFEGTDLAKPDSVKQAEELTSHVLYVVKLGPDAYKDEKKFPSGPWCKEGDFVLTRAYAGTRFRVFGREMRVINDDQVDGVIDDPRGVSRV